MDQRKFFLDGQRCQTTREFRVELKERFSGLLQGRMHAVATARVIVVQGGTDAHLFRSLGMLQAYVSNGGLQTTRSVN